MMVLCANLVSQRPLGMDASLRYGHGLAKVKWEVLWNRTYFGGLMGEADLLKSWRKQLLYIQH